MKTSAKKSKTVKPAYGEVVSPRGPDWRIRDGFKPTRSFEIGELVSYGNHDKCEILESLHDGAVYKVRCFGSKPIYGIPTEYEDFQQVAWHDLFHIDGSLKTSFKKEQIFEIRNSSSNIQGLISMVVSEYAGVDFTPEYQRGYVWTDDDKEKLIDSIFSNVSIGSFLFASLPFAPNAKHYEVIDGKQRLTTLVEFYEDRFPFKGVYFSQLSRSDANHFENYSIMMGKLEEPTYKQKLAAFLAVNTTGKVMDQDHLDTIKEELNSL